MSVLSQAIFVFLVFLAGMFLGATLSHWNRKKVGEAATIPQQPPDGPFQMVVEDFWPLLRGPGSTPKVLPVQTVVEGTILEGEIKVGNTLFVRTVRHIPVQVHGIAAERETLARAKAGDRVNLLLNGIRSDQIERRDVVTYPNGTTAGGPQRNEE